MNLARTYRLNAKSLKVPTHNFIDVTPNNWKACEPPKGARFSVREKVSIVNAEIIDDNQTEDMPRNESLFVEHRKHSSIASDPR